MSKFFYSMVIRKTHIFLIYLLFISLSINYLEASIINPILNRDMPGLEDFENGQQSFKEENWKEATYFFSQAIKKSYKPSFQYDIFLEQGNPPRDAEDEEFEEDDDRDRFLISEFWPEITYAVYRHSHFQLGLINLYHQEFAKADTHFRRAIGFSGYEEKMGSLFFRCTNLIDPSWIIYASQTSLYLGKLELAKQLADMAYNTLDDIDRFILVRSNWSNELEYWFDLQKRGITKKAWVGIQEIIASNQKSIVAYAQNDLKRAIDEISDAIRLKDYNIKIGAFLEDVTENFVL